MKNFGLLFWLLAGLFLACKQTTTATGTVKNGADDKPLEGVKVSLSQSSVVNGQTQAIAYEETFTDQDGWYCVDLKGERGVYVNMVATLAPFAPVKDFDLSNGKCNERDIKMYTIDSWLKLTLSNENSSGGWIYWAYTYFGVEADINPANVPQGTSRTEVIKLPGGSQTFIFWGTKSFLSIDKALNKDSVFIKRGDTTNYTIKF